MIIWPIILSHFLSCIFVSHSCNFDSDVFLIVLYELKLNILHHIYM